MAKTRRTFTPEFKAQAVKLVTEQGKSLAEVARDLDLGESMLRSLEAGPGQGRRPGLPRQGQPARPGGGTAPPPGREQAAHDGARHPASERVNSRPPFSPDSSPKVALMRVRT